MTIVQKALVFATAAHAAMSHYRKYDLRPYIVHPIEVMEMIRKVPGHTQEMLAAALLHDVVEDTGVKLELIYEEFGQTVGDLVEQLTDISKKEDGNRKVRKEKDRQHSANASPEGQTIKLADILCNEADIKKHDPSFYKSAWHPEKVELLKVLTKGDKTLHAKAVATINPELEA